MPHLREPPQTCPSSNLAFLHPRPAWCTGVLSFCHSYLLPEVRLIQVILLNISCQRRPNLCSHPESACYLYSVSLCLLQMPRSRLRQTSPRFASPSKLHGPVRYHFCPLSSTLKCHDIFCRGANTVYPNHISRASPLVSFATYTHPYYYLAHVVTPRRSMAHRRQPPFLIPPSATAKVPSRRPSTSIVTTRSSSRLCRMQRASRLAASRRSSLHRRMPAAAARPIIPIRPSSGAPRTHRRVAYSSVGASRGYE
jgi:hypothetical protein